MSKPNNVSAQNTFPGVDIIILMDTSTSMCSPQQPNCLGPARSDPNGLRDLIVLSFVAQLKDQIRSGKWPQNTRVGLLSFGKQVQEIVSLKDIRVWNPREEIKLENIPAEDATNFLDAFRMAINMFSKSRTFESNRLPIIILLSDGVLNPFPGTYMTIDQERERIDKIADLLANYNIFIYWYRFPTGTPKYAYIRELWLNAMRNYIVEDVQVSVPPGEDYVEYVRKIVERNLTSLSRIINESYDDITFYMLGIDSTEVVGSSDWQLCGITRRENVTATITTVEVRIFIQPHGNVFSYTLVAPMIVQHGNLSCMDVSPPYEENLVGARANVITLTVKGEIFDTEKRHPFTKEKTFYKDIVFIPRINVELIDFPSFIVAKSPVSFTVAIKNAYYMRDNVVDNIHIWRDDEQLIVGDEWIIERAWSREEDIYVTIRLNRQVVSSPGDADLSVCVEDGLHSYTPCTHKKLLVFMPISLYLQPKVTKVYIGSYISVDITVINGKYILQHLPDWINISFVRNGDTLHLKENDDWKIVSEQITGEDIELKVRINTSKISEFAENVYNIQLNVCLNFPQTLYIFSESRCDHSNLFVLLPPTPTLVEITPTYTITPGQDSDSSTKNRLLPLWKYWGLFVSFLRKRWRLLVELSLVFISSLLFYLTVWNYLGEIFVFLAVFLNKEKYYRKAQEIVVQRGHQEIRRFRSDFLFLLRYFLRFFGGPAGHWYRALVYVARGNEMWRQALGIALAERWASNPFAFFREALFWARDLPSDFFLFVAFAPLYFGELKMQRQAQHSNGQPGRYMRRGVHVLWSNMRRIGNAFIRGNISEAFETLQALRSSVFLEPARHLFDGIHPDLAPMSLLAEGMYDRALRDARTPRPVARWRSDLYFVWRVLDAGVRYKLSGDKGAQPVEPRAESLEYWVAKLSTPISLLSAIYFLLIEGYKPEVPPTSVPDLGELIDYAEKVLTFLQQESVGREPRAEHHLLVVEECLFSFLKEALYAESNVKAYTFENCVGRSKEHVQEHMQFAAALKVVQVLEKASLNIDKLRGAYEKLYSQDVEKQKDAINILRDILRDRDMCSTSPESTSEFLFDQWQCVKETVEAEIMENIMSLEPLYRNVARYIIQQWGDGIISIGG